MATTGVQFVDNLILGFNRISNEKKETFLKLLVLSIAAILCELSYKRVHTRVLLILQLFLQDYLLCCDLRVLSMNLIRKCFHR